MGVNLNERLDGSLAPILSIPKAGKRSRSEKSIVTKTEIRLMTGSHVILIKKIYA